MNNQRKWRSQIAGCMHDCVWSLEHIVRDSDSAAKRWANDCWSLARTMLTDWYFQKFEDPEHSDWTEHQVYTEGWHYTKGESLGKPFPSHSVTMRLNRVGPSKPMVPESVMHASRVMTGCLCRGQRKQDEAALATCRRHTATLHDEIKRRLEQGDIALKGHYMELTPTRTHSHTLTFT